MNKLFYGDNLDICGNLSAMKRLIFVIVDRRLIVSAITIRFTTTSAVKIRGRVGRPRVQRKWAILLSLKAINLIASGANPTTTRINISSLKGTNIGCDVFYKLVPYRDKSNVIIVHRVCTRRYKFVPYATAR